MKKGKSLIYMLVLLFYGSCIDPYQPPEITLTESYLVIDGFLNANDTSTVYLSRTQPLSENENASFEPTFQSGEDRAQVWVEQENDTRLVFESVGAGLYILPPADLDFNQKVRLHVKNFDGKEYVSDYVPITQSPAIDSISWKVEDNGVQLYVTTHDPANESKYYRWQFEETWRFNSAFNSQFVYVEELDTIEFRWENIYVCWRDDYSNDIYVGSSERLSEDVIFEYPLNHIRGSSPRIKIKYSILVKQNVLTKEGFDYYENLKSNTESLGSLFDPQPFQLTGNIQNINDSEEPVIGFFSAGTVAEKRIFISRNDLPYWQVNNEYSACFPDTVELADLDEYLSSRLLLDEIMDMTGNVIAYRMASPFCTDCRLRGTNEEPDFWE
ncbi:MAG: DUF4249 domain-containing protein [Candidatus Cyclobacteriaceae bacterium M3_2C_046]